MGKKDDWFSSEGLANREAGVKHKESKERKLCICVFWAICAVIWLVLGSLHISRFSNATAINSDYNSEDKYGLI